MRIISPVRTATAISFYFGNPNAFFRQGIRLGLAALTLVLGDSELYAQVFPAENEVMYQTQIMFSVTPVINAVNYRFIIEDKNIVKDEKCAATLIEQLEFGKQYEWKVEITLPDSSKITEKHRFFIAEQTYSEASLLRFRPVSKNNQAEHYQQGVIMLDYGSVAINRQGEVVWFLNRNVPQLKDMYSRPMIFNSSGNIMMTSANGAMECTLNGTVVWQTPDSTIFDKENPMHYKHRYHHDIQKLKNGNHLTLIKYYPKRILAGVRDSVTTENDAIVIFDKSNKIVWSWRLGDKLSFAEMSNFFNRNRAHGETTMPVGEINSVFLDESRNLMYVSIRDFSSIVVVEYPSGKMLRTYGNPLDGAEKNYLPGAFKHQHGGVPDLSGNLCVFNNNGEFDEQKMSEVLLIRQPASKTDSAKVTWSFNCYIDNQTPGKTPRLGFAMPLSNGNILVCMGFAGRLFEVTPDKRVVWDCIAETAPSITSANNPWTAKPNYRAHFYPSLYPNYFMIQHSISKEGVHIHLFNKGFSNDSYKLYIKSRNGKRKMVMALSVDAATDKKFIYCPPKAFKKGSDVLELESDNSGQIRIIPLN